jgi:hypothetical protein
MQASDANEWIVMVMETHQLTILLGTGSDEVPLLMAKQEYSFLNGAH